MPAPEQTEEHVDFNLSFDWNGGSYMLEAKDAGRTVDVECYKERRKIKFWSFSMTFYYYRIAAWKHPFKLEPFGEQDRARVAAKAKDFLARKGWKVIIDRSRFCPHCSHEVAGSNSEEWPGGTCDFCGKELDQSGRVIP